MATNQGFASISIVDRGGELTGFKVAAEQISETTYAGWMTAYGTFRNAVSAVIAGEIFKETKGNEIQFRSRSNPAPNQSAHRELKFLCIYEDTVTLKTHRFEIGTADDSLTNLFVSATSDEVDLVNCTEMAALKTAFEAFVIGPDSVDASPGNGNAVTLREVILVGRNN